MPVIISMGTFIAVFLFIFGFASRSASTDPMDTRLGGLRYARPKKEIGPDPEAGFRVRVLQPLMQTLSQRANRMLPSSMTESIDRAILQAGLKIRAGQLIVVVAILAGVVPILGALYMTSMGSSSKNVMLFYVVLVGLGILGPRIWLQGKVKRRKKEIWKSLPDAFDLITASVEAGLGVDAAFTRVIDKVKGPFAVELSRTMREINVGRSRREAFVDMAARTGVEELRKPINAIVQAETMGISIGNVIRVQTGVIRTKRKQHAEEQAFKAPIKMVFPLVFFIFPAILTVIGGPAMIIIIRNGFAG